MGRPHPKSAPRTVNERRLAIKALLGREITHGLDLLAEPPSGDPKWQNGRTEEWHCRVLRLVADSLGTGEMSRMQFWGESSRTDLIKARLAQIANLIRYVDTGLIVPEFDPWA